MAQDSNDESFKNCEKGALLVEFAFALILLLTVTIGVVDFSIVAYRFAGLTLATTSATRDTAASLSLPQLESCESIAAASAGALENSVLSSGYVPENVSLSLSVGNITSAPYPVLNVIAATEVDCLFCRLYLNDGTLRIEARSIVENTELECDEEGV